MKAAAAQRSHRIAFEPALRTVAVPAGEHLLDAARRQGVSIAAACGGQGRCRACRVQVVEGEVETPAATERLLFSEAEWREGWRRACRSRPLSDGRVWVPPRAVLAPQRTQVEGEAAAVRPDPAARGYPVAIAPAGVGDLRSEANRLTDALRARHGVEARLADPPVLRELAARLAAGEREAVAVVRAGAVIAVLPAGRRPLGLALDLGTTKLAGYLLDLAGGRTLAAAGRMNPQIAHGDDLISRIAHAGRSDDDARALQDLLAGALNALARSLCREARAAPGDVVEVVAAGNTAMHHLLLRLPVAQLARAPYVPAVTEPLELPARDVGLRLAPGAVAHLLPNLAGFVGGDHAAMLLAVDAARAGGTQLFLDIGTNSEVSLVADGAIYSVSCASGPAFEGGHIHDGMRAAPGAIEKVWLIAGEPHYQTIGNEPPVGLCGSGVLDAVNRLTDAGVLDAGGRMRGDHPRVRRTGAGPAFVLVAAGESAGGSEVWLTQKDVRELQMAKAAVRAGIEVLLGEAGRPAGDLERVTIAGAFGSYIDVDSAVAIGMLPRLPRERFHQVGNAAGAGARMALASRAARAEAQRLLARTRYVELATHAAFNDLFTRSLTLRSEEPS